MNCSFDSCRKEGIWIGEQKENITFARGGFKSTPGEYHYCDFHKKIVSGYDIPNMVFRNEEREKEKEK